MVLVTYSKEETPDVIEEEFINDYTFFKGLRLEDISAIYSSKKPLTTFFGITKKGYIIKDIERTPIDKFYIKRDEIFNEDNIFLRNWKKYFGNGEFRLAFDRKNM